MFFPPRSARTAGFFKATVDAARTTMTSLLNTSSDPRATAVALGRLSSRMRALLRRDQQAGSSFIDDPEFFNLMRNARDLIDKTSSTARDAFFMQVMRVIATLPMPRARLLEIIATYPDVQECVNEHVKTLGGAGDPLGGWPCANLPAWPSGWPPGCGGSSGASGGGDTGPGCGGGGGGGEGGGGTGTGGGPHAGGCTSNVHVHVHCCEKKGKE
jgi:hypothetical protein